MADSNEVFVKTENISDKLEAEKIREKLETQRERRRLVEKFKRVKGLADSSDDEDAAEWYRRVKRREERTADKARKQEDKDKHRTEDTKVRQYSAKQLKGLAIGHKVDSIKEGQQLVLTLRDREVLDEDEDVLVNVNLLDDEKAAKNVENKTKRPEYRPYDDEEFDEFGNLQKSALLSKYDEEIQGPQQEMFRIGTSVPVNLQNLKTDFDSNAYNGGSNNKVSLDRFDLKIANEYYTAEEMAVKFKKPSKKKGAQLRKRNQPTKSKFTVDSKLDNQDITDDDPSPDESPKRKKARNSKNADDKKTLAVDLDDLDDDNLVGPDEDLSGFTIEDEAENELQFALHKTRKIKLKEKCIDPAENIAKIVNQVKEERGDDMMETEEEPVPLPTGQIVMNATAEFCRNLGEYSGLVRKENRRRELSMNDDINDDDDADESGGASVKLKQGDNDEDEDDNKYLNNWNEVDTKMEEDEDVSEDEKPIRSQPILEEEPDVSVGVAGALKLAMTKGYLDKDAPKTGGTTRASSAIQAQSYTIEEKFYEDDRHGRRERYSGPIQEFRDKDGYKPDFKLDYVDEKGRIMNQKEAFRYLSHKFHGKGPGKNKIDKRMKKMEQESKLRQMSSIDTPLNTVKLLQERQKELQMPYVVLGTPKSSATNITQISKTK